MQRRTLAVFAFLMAWPPFVPAWHVPPGITFDEGLIPERNTSLPILSLGHHATIPDDLFEKLIAPNTTVTRPFSPYIR
jgi:hypothetical protein